ncbi:MAG: acyl-[acyl-carrier-protein]--UDP-N-acetylglucosamine O-acyltransferase, partial [Elusimicrobia bacterium RIFCSPLOWO2_01_FULL_59_12]
ADGVDIGPYAVIGEEVILHPRVRVGPHAVVEFAEVGEACQIHAGSFVGTAPQDLKYRGERTRVILGPGCVVRECVTLNRGTAASGVTRIGARCLFMAYAHVAHDCHIGQEVVLANSVAVAGHAEIGDGAVIGGMVGLHQFVRVGKLAMIGAGAMVPLDIPPFTLAWGDRAKLNGLNLIGLRRRGYSAEHISALKRAYRDVFSSSLPMADLLEQMSQQPQSDPVKELIAFLQKSSRGFCRPATAGGPEDKKTSDPS